MTKLTVLSVAAAVLGKAHASEDEALNELNGLVPQITELKALRESRDIVSAEFGNEKDPTKVVGQIRELRAQVKTATDAAAAQKKAAVKATVDATIKQYENRLGNKPLAERLTRDLTAELEGGATVENAPTVAILKSLTVDPKFVRNAGADNGENATAEKKVVARAEEFMRTDEEVKQLAKTNRHAAYNMAVDKAEAELLADSTK